MSAQRMNRVIRMNRVTPMNRVVRMNRILSAPPADTFAEETLAHIARVESDSGVVYSPSLTDELIVHAKDNGYYDDIALLVTPDTGILQNFIESVEHTQKGYDLGPDDNDVENTTAAEQPENVEGAAAGLPTGRRAWRFDGGQHLVLPAGSEASFDVNEGAFFAVFKLPDTLNDGERRDVFAVEFDGVDANRLRIQKEANGDIRLSRTGDSESTHLSVGAGSLTAGTWVCAVLRYSITRGNATGYLNGQQFAEPSIAVAGTSDEFVSFRRQIGAGQTNGDWPWNSNIAAVGFIQGAEPSHEQALAISAFLMQKYGITP